MNFLISNLYAGQENLLVLISALVIANIIQRNGLFNIDWIANKKIQLIVGSIFFGVLPIEGRITASLPMFKEFSKSEKTNTMAFVGYLSTHHYYLWSPIEKSVLIIMAGLHLTYLEFITLTAPILITYLSILIFYIIQYVEFENDTKIKKFPIQSLPFFASIVLALFFPLYYVLPLVAVYYYIRFGKKCDLYISYKSVLTVGFIIIISNVIKENSETLLALVHPENFALALLFTFVLSFFMGSSSKYAGITVAMCAVFGIQFFSIVFIADYIGYLLSPAHKCTIISHRMLKMSLLEFYKPLLTVCLILFFVVLMLNAQETLFVTTHYS